MIKKAGSFFAVLLLCIACAKSALAAEADGGGGHVLFETNARGGLYFEDFLREQESYPGLADFVLQGTLEPRWFFIAHYPQGFGEKADLAIRNFACELVMELVMDQGTAANEFFSKRFAKPEDIQRYEQDVEEELKGEEGAVLEYWEAADYFSRTMPVFISYSITESSGAFSVNFCKWSYGGGAHDNWIYKAISIDKASGERIELQDLFKSPGSLERTSQWLNSTPDAGYYYNGSCQSNETNLERTPINLESSEMFRGGLDMERILIKPEGIEVVFAPYEQGSFAMGDVHAPIPLAELEKLGVSMRFWQAAEAAK